MGWDRIYSVTNVLQICKGVHLTDGRSLCTKQAINGGVKGEKSNRVEENERQEGKRRKRESEKSGLLDALILFN